MLEQYNLINFNQLRAIVKNVKTNVTCPSCDENFSNDDLSIVSAMFNKCGIAAECRNCGTPILITINITRKDEKSAEAEIIVEDTDSAKARYTGTFITADDVCNMHEFLKDFDGDFNAIFEEKSESKPKKKKKNKKKDKEGNK